MSWIVLIAALGAVTFLVWLWALVSALRNEGLDSTERLTWVLVVLLANFPGALVYLLFAPRRHGPGARPS